MRKLSNLTESIWSDIQKRSSGENIRKEDDINTLDGETLKKYLQNNYKPLKKFSNIIYTESIEVLSVPIIVESTTSCVHFDFKCNHINITNEIVDNIPGLLKKINDNFKVDVYTPKERDFIMYTIYPKDKSEVTNKFFIEVLDFLLDNTPESEKSFEKTNNKS